jgi:dTDP-glucose pyrophosphorylase
MFYWEKALVNPQDTVRRAIEVIDASGVQAAIVVDENYVLVGLVTDGDIRRAILNGVDLQTPVGEVMNTNPKTALAGADNADVFDLMKATYCHQIPIINSKGRVVDVKIFDELVGQANFQSNPVLLMAGGLGSRLGDLTQDTPKPLLKVGGTPILETIILNLVNEGFKKFFISVNYQAQKIMDYFGNGMRFGVQIEYLVEPMKMGTAGALSLLPKNIKMPLIVMNGDLLTDISVKRMLNYHHENDSNATMAVRSIKFDIPYGVVSLKDNQIVNLKEKPTHELFVNAGIYIVNPDVLRLVPSNIHFDMTSLFQALMEQNKKCSAFPIREYWMDIGLKDDFQKANLDFKKLFSMN